MMEEKELVQNLFEGLIKHLIVLTLPAEFQKEYIGLGHTGDELALELESHYTLQKERYVNEGFINQIQKELLDSLDNFFDSRGGEKFTDFWEGVDTHSDWEIVRKLAKDCLIALNMQDYGIKVKSESVKSYSTNTSQWHMHSIKTELIKKK